MDSLLEFNDNAGKVKGDLTFDRKNFHDNGVGINKGNQGSDPNA